MVDIILIIIAAVIIGITAALWYAISVLAKWLHESADAVNDLIERYDTVAEYANKATDEELLKAFEEKQEPMTFRLSPSQINRVRAWQECLPKLKQTAIGGAYEYIFNPTGIGLFVTCKRCDGHKIDLTEDF